MAADQGAKVWAAGRSEAHIETARQVSGGSFEVRQADTHDAAALDAIFNEVGKIDHLVSAAVGGERTLKPFCSKPRNNSRPPTTCSGVTVMWYELAPLIWWMMELLP